MGCYSVDLVNSEISEMQNANLKFKMFTKRELFKNNLIFGMKVHLIRKETIEEYARHNARSRPSLQDWLSKLKYADWKTPEDIKKTFKSADLLGNGSDSSF
jgi:mRNA interferase HigB